MKIIADFEEDKKSVELNGTYTYGYRFHLNKLLKINDILISKQIFEINI